MLIVNEVEATEPPAVVDQISDLTAVPLFTPAWKLQLDPLSVIEPMNDEAPHRAHTATMVLLLPLLYAIDSDAGVLPEPVLLEAPPTREIADGSDAGGVEKTKLAEVAVPAELPDMTA
jgi:hypothetical protein